MRELKFRAWDGMKMYSPIIDSDGKVYRAYPDMEDRNYAPHDDVMQYTGLKDRNGKEIYEGDIFKIENHWPVYVVVYAKQAATFGLKSSGGPFKPFTTVLRDMKDYPLSEVLGNIHENPELLEEAATNA